ncbi:MAG: hypothetical protein K2X93_16530 [Candidatus Obscuribacterales bacterium]|nr:hypothetical protein [Candidatus Obscuribacterales bacterium]
MENYDLGPRKPENQNIDPIFSSDGVFAQIDSFADNLLVSRPSTSSKSLLPELVFFSYSEASEPNNEQPCPEKNAPTDKLPIPAAQPAADKVEIPFFWLESRNATTDKVTRVRDLSTAEQTRIAHTIQLQRYLRDFQDRLPFDSVKEREAFQIALGKELGRPSSDGGADAFERLPEFGDATKAGFKKLTFFLQHAVLPEQILTLSDLQLPMTPKCPLKAVTLQKGVVLSAESWRSLIVNGETTLEIDPNCLEDTAKLKDTMSWILDTSKRVDSTVTDRLEKLLSKELEAGIARKVYPETWRRQKGMNKADWCDAVEKAMDLYSETTRIAKRLDALKKVDQHFRVETTLKMLTDAGVKVRRHPITDDIESLDFGALMMKDLVIQSSDNMPIAFKLSEWCENYGKVADGFSKDMKEEHILGFGERDEPKAFLKPNTNPPESRVNVTNSAEIEQLKADGWQDYNLVRYRATISANINGKIRASTTREYIAVPVYGYLNLVGDSKLLTPPHTKDLEPDAWVPVYEGDFKVKAVQAKDLNTWLIKRELNYFGGKTISATMDGALIIGAGFGGAAVRKSLQMGLEQAGKKGYLHLATKNGAQELSTMPSKFSNLIPVYESIKAGTSGVVGGLRLATESAYAKERPDMKTTGEVLHYAMLGHSLMSVGSMLKVQKLIPGMLEKANPGLASSFASGAKSFKDFSEASRFVSVGATLAIGPAFKFGQVATRVALKTSEIGFLTMLAFDASRVVDNFRNKEKVAEGLKQLEVLKGKKLEDPTLVEPLSLLCARPEVAVEQMMTLYKQSLGQLSEEQNKDIDEIQRKTVLRLSSTEQSQEKRIRSNNDCVKELMKYLCYDRDYFIESRRGDNRSEEDLASEALTDRELYSPEVKIFAALAILALSRSEDGQLSKVAGERQFIDGSNTYKQQLLSRDLAKLVHADLNSVSGAERTKKAEALNAFGLCSTEHLIDLKMRQIEGWTPASNEDKYKALTDVARLISRQSLEEQIRDQRLTVKEKAQVNGANLGLASIDNRDRLLSAAQSCSDPNLQAGILFAWSTLNRTKLDGTDIYRIADASAKELSPTLRRDYLVQLRQDLDSRPTDDAGWDRRLNAAVTLLQFKETDLRQLQVANTIVDCLRQQQSPVVALEALRFLNTDAGQNIIEQLQKSSPAASGADLGSDVFLDAVKVVGRLTDDKTLPSLVRANAASLRIDAVELVTDLALNRSRRDVEKGVLGAELLRMLPSHTEGVLDVRIAVIKSLVKLSLNDSSTVNSIKKLATVETEPDARIRLEAVKALNALVGTNRERKSILSPLILKEDDRAVVDALMPHYRPSGLLADGDSQTFNQRASDLQGERSREDPADASTKAWLAAQRIKVMFRGAGKQDIWNYFDPGDAIQQTRHSVVVARASADSEIRNQRKSGETPKRYSLEDDLCLEMCAQYYAHRTYVREVDKLYQTALSGKEHSKESMLALALLIRDGSQMGAPFYQHRRAAYSNEIAVSINTGKCVADKTNCYARAKSDDTAIVLVPYSEWEQNYRSNYAWPFPSLEGVRPRPFDADPWNDVEPDIARKLVSLAVTGRNREHASILGDQFLKILGNRSLQSAASDKARIIVLEGIESLFVKPELSISEKQRLLNGLRESIEGVKGVESAGLSASMVKTMELLDKHVEKNGGFEKYSGSMSLFRVALKSHVVDKVGMPLDCRSRAQEILARRWESVRSEYHRLPPSTGSLADRERRLPKAPSQLLKESLSKTDGRSEIVHDAVQGILSSVKGRALLLDGDDPRTEKIAHLTNPIYDDRVRMAACFALAVSPENALKETASQVALELVTNSTNPATRYDAALLLKYLRPPDASPWLALTQIRTQLVECMTGNRTDETWLSKEPSEFVAAARQFIAQRIDKPATKQKAVDALNILHHYGEALVVAGEMELRTDGGDLGEAEMNIRSGLAALGVQKADIGTLRRRVASGTFDSTRNRTKELDALTLRLREEHDYTGSLPALVLALDSLSSISIRLLEMGILDRSYTAIGSAGLMENLTLSHFPDGTLSRAENLQQVGRIFQEVAKSSKVERWRRGNYLEDAQRYFEVARTEFTKAQAGANADALNLTLFDTQESRLQVLYKPNPSGDQLKSLRTIHGGLDKVLQQYPSKDSFNFHRDTFRKDWFGIVLAEPDQRAVAQQTARAALDQATRAAIVKTGRISSDYTSILSLAARFFKDQNKLDDGVEYFANELRNATSRLERSSVLNQCQAFAGKNTALMQRIESRAKAK